MGSDAAQAQMAASQVITLTTGSEGKFLKRTRTTNTTEEQIFNFSQTSGEEMTTTPRRSRRSGQTVTQEDTAQFNAASFVLEQGVKRETTTVRRVESYEYSDATFGQTFSISY